MKLNRYSRLSTTGFSLVELLTAMALLSLILALLFSVMQNSQKVLTQASAQFEQFEQSKAAFESITRRLTDCVLNPYWGYDYPGDDTSQSPTGFSRQSELHFITGPAHSSSDGSKALLADDPPPSHAVFFHGPFGVNNQTDWDEYATLINGWGYYIDYVNLEESLPPFIEASISNGGYRFRLMELRVPAEQLITYQSSASRQTGRWYQEAINNGHVSLVASNVVALIITPQAPEGTLSHPTEIAPNYTYNTVAYLSTDSDNYAIERSRHQLPPLLRFTMVVLDEDSAIRLSEQWAAATPDLGFSDLFKDARKYQEDLATFEQGLTDQGLQYRTFSTMIRLRNARWSETLPASQ